nr:MAG TPA: hypothetical protein [Caudoviricetes sp.]
MFCEILKTVYYRHKYIYYKSINKQSFNIITHIKIKRQWRNKR